MTKSTERDEGRRMTEPSQTINNHAAFIWSVADLLRGDYKQSEYGKVILPLTVLRRLDCVLEPTKAKVLDRHEQLAGRVENVEPVLLGGVGRAVLQHLASSTLTRLLDDPERPRRQPARATSPRSPTARETCSRSSTSTPRSPGSTGRTCSTWWCRKFAEIDLHPDVGVQHRDGLPVRGADPQVLRAVQRDRRRALHPARGDPADGEPAVHRGRRPAHQARHRARRCSTRPAAPAACCRSPRTTSASSTRTPRSRSSARS